MRERLEDARFWMLIAALGLTAITIVLPRVTLTRNVYDLVAIVDITNGARIETYVIPGPRGTGVIGINGAAAHLVHPDDLVIIMSYGMFEDADARALVPTVVHVDGHNRVVKVGNDPAEPVPGSDQLRGDLVDAS